MNERTAHAVVQLQGAFQGVYDGVFHQVKPEPRRAKNLRGSTVMLDDCEAQLELATVNELELGNVRDMAKKAVIDEMPGSTGSYLAMPNLARVLEILYDACECVRGSSQDDAEKYTISHGVLLTTAGTPSEKRTRVSERLLRIASHVIGALQKVAILA